MPVRLTRLTLREIRLPLVEPFRSAGGTVDARRIVLLELADADGHIAWSECVAQEHPTYSPDTVDSCWLALTRWIAPLALGATYASPAALHAALARTVRGHHMARAAVEMGAWVIEAERRGIGLATALAQAAGAEPRTRVGTGIAIGLQATPELLVARAAAARAEGYRRIRIKVEPGRDVAFVRAVREALPDAALGADGNCAYSLDDAEQFAALATLDSLGLVMLEQPLAHDDVVAHAALQRRLHTSICLDESITGDASVATMLALGAGRMVNLKPGRVGGFTESLAIHWRCASRTMPLWCGGMLESGIGRAYNVALASLPGFTEPGDLSPSARYWSRDVVTPAWTMDASGGVRVPLDRPGLGVGVDVAFIDDCTVRVESFGAS